MSRYKGMSSKGALDVDDLIELHDIYHRLQRLHGQLNAVSSQRLPLMAASATVKAAWAELSGAEQGWSFPVEAMVKATARMKAAGGS